VATAAAAPMGKKGRIFLLAGDQEAMLPRALGKLVGDEGARCGGSAQLYSARRRRGGVDTAAAAPMGKKGENISPRRRSRSDITANAGEIGGR
jgi:hypothetical protein